MAEVKRISNKSSIDNGSATTNLSLNDKLLTQHTSGDNTDHNISILQAQLTPYGTCATASATATKTVTMVNFPDDFTALVGTKIRVKFTYQNTASSQMYLKVGSLSAKPATCRGVAMASGSIRAGAEIEFMYDGTNWDCQFSEPISAMDTASASPINSSALNGALAEYQKVEDIYTQLGDTADADDFISTSGYKIRWGRFYNNTNDYTTYHLPQKNWNIIQWVPLTSNGTYGYQVSYTTESGTPNYKRMKSNGTWGNWVKIIGENDLFAKLGVSYVNSSVSTANSVIMHINISSGNFGTFILTASGNDTVCFTYTSYDERLSSVSRLINRTVKFASIYSDNKGKDIYINVNSWSGHKQFNLIGGNIAYTVETVTEIPSTATQVTINNLVTESGLTSNLADYQGIRTHTIASNSSYTTDIYANTSIPLESNTLINKLLRQKAYLVMLSTITDTGDKSAYILGVIRIGRNGGNVTFYSISENGASDALAYLKKVTFTVGTGDTDTVVVTNSGSVAVMIDFIV